MKILHLDIETAPNTAYVWGLFKQNVNINHIIESGYTMCWSAKWHGKRKVFFNSTQMSKPKDMLQEIWNLLDEADAVVHFNGNKFDMPILNKDFLMHGLMPPSPYHQVDLLNVARSSFRFTSNKLDYISKVLGIGSKFEHYGFELWIDCMKGEKKAWKIMEKYNKKDVTLLEDLYEEFLPWIKNHPNHALYTDEVAHICPNCGGKRVKKNGTETTKVMRYQRYKCQDCGLNIKGRQADKLSKEKKKSILISSKL